MSGRNTINTTQLPSIILVSGMHRSGTSAATKALASVGVRLGDSLLPADSGNPTGYWEHTEAVAINEAVLSWMNIHWDEPLIAACPDTQLPEQLIHRAAAFLATNAGCTPFAFKDPRATRLIPFWQAAANYAAQDHALDFQYVIVVRNPLDAARSLAKRNGIGIETGLALWLEHMLAMAASVEWNKTTVVEFEALLRSPDTTLDTLAGNFASGEEKHSANLPNARAAFIEEFLNKQKLLLCSAKEELEPYSAQFPLLLPVYTALQKAASGTIDSTTQQWFATCWQAYGLGANFSCQGALKRNYSESLTPDELQFKESVTGDELCLQLYFDTGNGFNEEEKLHRIVSSGNVQVVFSIPENATGKIRLDPGDTPCLCILLNAEEHIDETVHPLLPVNDNAAMAHSDVYTFRDDPWIEFSISPESTSVSFSLHHIALSESQEQNILHQQCGVIAALMGWAKKTDDDVLTAEKAWHELAVKQDTFSAENQRMQAQLAAHEDIFNRQQEQHIQEVLSVKKAHTSEIENLNEQLTELHDKLASHKHLVSEQQAEARLSLRSTQEVQKSLQVLQQENVALRTAIQDIKNSRTWRYARFILDKLEKVRWFRSRFSQSTGKTKTPCSHVVLPHTAPEIPEVLEHALCIVIPVYNGVNALCSLFDSLMQSYPYALTNLEFIIIDDASPDDAVCKVLSSHSFCKRSDVHVYTNRKNLGFTGTANRGISLAKKADVVLLNSDTEVWTNAFHVLQHVAYRDATIASVTPLTNKGTIASLQNWPDGTDTIFQVPPADIAHIVHQVNIKTPMQHAPTGVGFCMYMKRAAIEHVGVLDVKTFGKGYGEENDWSQRAVRKGFCNIICTETYVHHAETQSFTSEAKKEAIRVNLAKLRKKHPTYDDQVETYIRQESLKAERELILWNILKRSKEYAQRKTVLHVLHKSPMNHLGGTELHVRHLTEKTLALHNIEAIWMAPDIGGIRITLVVPPLESVFTMLVPDAGVEEMLPAVLEHADLIHIHHLHGYSNDQIALIRNWDLCPKIFTVHDFGCLCPSWNLLRNGTFCNSSTMSECQGCEHEQDMLHQRTMYADLLEQCDSIITPSLPTAAILKRCLGNSSADVQDKIVTYPHMLTFSAEPQNTCSNATPRIVFLGGLTEAKGAELVSTAFNHFLSQNYQCEVWGEAGTAVPDGTVIRRYSSRSELSELSKAYKADVVCLPSIWPETFCYTLYEALCIVRAPVVCGPYGNPAAVVRNNELGVVLNECTPSSLINGITRLLDSKEYAQKVATYQPEMLNHNYAEEYCNAVTRFLS